MKKDLEWLKENVKEEYEYNIAKYNKEGFEPYAHSRVFAFKYVLDLIDQLDDPEVLSQEWIDEHKFSRINNLRKMTMSDVVSVDKLQNLLVPKQEEITEEQAWEVLSELYDIPNKSYIREAMRVVADYVGNDMTIGELKEKFAKPVIPQFMADFIEVRKDTDAYSLKYILHLLAGREEMQRHTKDYDWIEENEELFTRAWLDGYEVAEEPKYRLKLNGDHLSRVQIDYGAEEGKPIEVTILADVKGLPYNFSEDEKSHVEKYLNVEVEELGE